MKTILLSLLLLGTSTIFFAQITTTEIVASGDNVLQIDPYSVTLKSGFWAKSGSTFTASIGYAGINWNCPIVTEKGFTINYVNANSYTPKSIDTNKKLSFTYDTAGNTTRIYFANAATANTAKPSADSTSSASSTAVYDLDTLKSLVYVYPNPTKGKITVHWDDRIDRLIRSAELITPNNVRIPLRLEQINGKRQASLVFDGAAGSYFLRVLLTDSRAISKIILKQ